MTQQIPILYGTETGNAEYCAARLADRLRDEGFAAEVDRYGGFRPAGPRQPVVGHRDHEHLRQRWRAPSNAEELLEHLQNEDLDVTHLRFAVCGLGDTSFSHFAQCGKDFEAAFLRCKAKGALWADCDAHFEPEFEAFADTAVAYLTTRKGALDDTPANDEPVAAANDETHPAKGLITAVVLGPSLPR